MYLNPPNRIFPSPASSCCVPAEADYLDMQAIMIRAADSLNAAENAEVFRDRGKKARKTKKTLGLRAFYRLFVMNALVLRGAFPYRGVTNRRAGEP